MLWTHQPPLPERGKQDCEEPLVLGGTQPCRVEVSTQFGDFDREILLLQTLRWMARLLTDNISQRLRFNMFQSRMDGTQNAKTHSTRNWWSWWPTLSPSCGTEGWRRLTPSWVGYAWLYVNILLWRFRLLSIVDFGFQSLANLNVVIGVLFSRSKESVGSPFGTTTMKLLQW